MEQGHRVYGLLGQAHGQAEQEQLSGIEPAAARVRTRGGCRNAEVRGAWGDHHSDHVLSLSLHLLGQSSGPARLEGSGFGFAVAAERSGRSFRGLVRRPELAKFGPADGSVGVLAGVPTRPAGDHDGTLATLGGCGARYRSIRRSALQTRFVTMACLGRPAHGSTGIAGRGSRSGQPRAARGRYQDQASLGPGMTNST